MTLQNVCRVCDDFDVPYMKEYKHGVLVAVSIVAPNGNWQLVPETLTKYTPGHIVATIVQISK